MSQKVMLSINELIDEINNRDEIFVVRGLCRHAFPQKNEDLLDFVLTKAVVDHEKEEFRKKLAARTLSDLMNARGGKSAVVGERIALAQKLGGVCDTNGGSGYFPLAVRAVERFGEIFCSSNLHKNFALKNMPGVYASLVEKPARPADWIAQNSGTDKRQALNQADKQLDVIRKSILYLYGTRQYAEFFWWLFLFAMLQSEIVYLISYAAENQYSRIVDYLEAKNGDFHEIRRKSLAQMDKDDFWDLRRKLVETAKGHLILAGPSLRKAFDVGSKRNLLKQLRYAVCSGGLSRVSVMLTDPLIFSGTRCFAPLRDIDSTVCCLEDNFYELCERNGVELNVYFLMMPQIDHAVISEEFMLFRSNKLWTDQRELKGGFMLYMADYYTSEDSEYRAHVDYLNLIMSSCHDERPETDVDGGDYSRQDARFYHSQWRKNLRTGGYQYVHFHYLYQDQLRSYMCQTWLPDLE